MIYEEGIARIDTSFLTRIEKGIKKWANIVIIGHVRQIHWINVFQDISKYG
jgi:hypothetical protein